MTRNAYFMQFTVPHEKAVKRYTSTLTMNMPTVDAEQIRKQLIAEAVRTALHLDRITVNPTAVTFEVVALIDSHAI